MKKTFLILALIGILTSCQDYKKDSEQKAIDRKIETELATGIHNDTIFLGFWFGMKDYDIANHLNSLVNQKKLSLNTNDVYEYEFDFGETSLVKKAVCGFSLKYFNDRLYQLIIHAESDEIGTSPELVQLTLVGSYADKYGHTYIKRKSVLGESNDYVWIDGNRMIEVIAGLTDALVIYTDLIAEQNKKEQDIKESHEKSEQIKGDL